VVTNYDRFHNRINRQWSGLIRSNQVLGQTRVISAYKRHQNLMDWLLGGKFGLDEEEDDPEALLSAVVEVLQREESPSSSSHSTCSGGP